MAITYVATSNGTAGDNASVTPALPTGWQAGDAHIVIASIRNSGTGTVDDHADYTTLQTFGNVKVLGRIAQASDTAPTITFTGGVAGATTLAQIVGLRGASLNLADVATQLNASAQNIAYPALDVTGDGRAILLFGWKQDDASSISTPAGFTAADQVLSTTGDDALQAIRYQIQTTEADISSGTLTVTGGAAAISRALVMAFAPPTLTATAVPDADPPRVDLTLAWAGASEITVQRVDPDGRTRPVRLAEPAELTAGAWTGSDYESWFGESTTYQATDGAATIDATAVTLDVDTAWLRHPGIPSLSVQVNVEGDGEPVRRINRAVHEPLGRRYPIVIADGRRKAKASTITFRTWTLAEADELLAALDDTAVLLLDVPPAWAMGITHQYMAFGDVVETRPAADNASQPLREFNIGYDVVDRPADTDTADRTWANVLTEAATWTDLLTLYDTWGDVLTGNP